MLVEHWQALHPDLSATVLDLWTTELPKLQGSVLAARTEVEAGRTPCGDAGTAWSRLQDLAAGLLSADRLLISAPMWNFGLPYRLKHYIDCVTQPTLTYRGSPAAGFEGLIPARPAALILTRGGSYPAGSEREPFDFQSRYLRTWLAFLGYRPVTTILVDSTTLDEESIRAGEAQVQELASRF